MNFHKLEEKTQISSIHSTTLKCIEVLPSSSTGSTKRTLINLKAKQNEKVCPRAQMAVEIILSKQDAGQINKLQIPVYWVF